MTPQQNFGWGRILRLGLVQAALGAVVVMTTSTLNRVMVVELALPALLPGLLVAIHYLVQVARPRMGYGSDLGQRRTPWIVGGMAVLASGGVAAAVATAWMGSHPAAGIALAVVAFLMIGLGVSASGTSLLVLLAKRVAPSRRAAAATVVWLMMIAGFAVTAGLAGRLLDPYTPWRLVQVSFGVSAIAFAMTLLALYRLEGDDAVPVGAAADAAPRTSFRDALAQVWAEPAARRFTLFIFVSMLAFSAQDLILEPFAGTVFGYTPGASTQLSGVQHGGVLVGMLLVAAAGSGLAGQRWGSLRAWTVGGCLASGVALMGLVRIGLSGEGTWLGLTVFLLGAANGAFSIAAIASMMRLAGEGRQAREGTRMGLWGGAQAVAFGLGGLVGTAASDLARWLVGTPAQAYAAVFALEALLFVGAALLAARVETEHAPAREVRNRSLDAASGVGMEAR
ncbi:BCD family MFS transporter [Methylibium sp. Root1272]|uniref:BCD family MFS transporter n=1 Tax=Methylibium sp. Root1272 TaxID=1736441 RepID=UPI0006FE494B|nr:BCD family MFS transporter [Methylibium sp. Root1272]KQW74187.1 bacteriochlorophyll synthase [Methylibium sp. Root1272]